MTSWREVNRARTVHIDLEITVIGDTTPEQAGEAVFDLLAGSEEPVEVVSVDGWEVR